VSRIAQKEIDLMDEPIVTQVGATNINVSVEEDAYYGRLEPVAIPCPMCRGECLQHKTYCGKCNGGGVIYRPKRLPIAKYNELEMITKTSCIIVQAMGYVAEGTWMQDHNLPTMWTIDEAVGCACDALNAETEDEDIEGVLWAVEQVVKALTRKVSRVRKQAIQEQIEKSVEEVIKFASARL
jgi:hypothetical protein